METVMTSNYMVEDLKVIKLDSDATAVSKVIEECIIVINNRKADYGAVLINGIRLVINKDDNSEDIYNKFKILNRIK